MEEEEVEDWLMEQMKNCRTLKDEESSKGFVAEGF